jgi:hypothetical protein
MIHDSGNLPGGIKIEREREKKKLKTKVNKKRGEREDTGILNDTPQSQTTGDLW